MTETAAERLCRLREELGSNHPATIFALQARITEMAAEEVLDQTEEEWWLDYTAENGEFLGVIIVQASGFIHAVLRTNELGINPGGEIQAAAYPLGHFPAEVQGRLLDFETLLDLGMV